MKWKVGQGKPQTEPQKGEVLKAGDRQLREHTLLTLHVHLSMFKQPHGKRATIKMIKTQGQHDLKQETRHHPEKS